ncbi:hypothetical protein like AT4G18220 [Hibiscus trionum]|uniref:Probable purine permease n=1 Tax=Hibiscus trionum TaxID=183268 RepID=A0A9W7JJT9_HIBTR|nr:hypothetical protein like AT4G18220 [Hibiscus trionum]
MPFTFFHSHSSSLWSNPFLAEAQQIQLLVKESKGSNSGISPTSHTTMSQPAKNRLIKWLRVAVYAVLAVAGQASAALLTRLYYQKGGTSKWLETLTQLAGFPILIPYYISQLRKDTPPQSSTAVETKPPPPSLPPAKPLTLVFVYVYLGILMAANSYLYSIGFEYLPVSIVSLISASQLAFNALFSYFLNSQKFTPFIMNSLLLLTISSCLVVSNDTTEKPRGVSDRNYALGFICTVFGTALYGLLLSSQQLVIRRVFHNKVSLKLVMDLAIYPSAVASVVTLIGFFVSGDFKLLNPEMNSYELGKESYAMTLVWTAICWQVSIFACLGLVSELSALFANVIFAVGFPVNTVAAIVVFNDRMNGVKGISLVLAIWGVISYAYQQYLDDRNAETKGSEPSEV